MFWTARFTVRMFAAKPESHVAQDVLRDRNRLGVCALGRLHGFPTVFLAPLFGLRLYVYVENGSAGEPVDESDEGILAARVAHEQGQERRPLVACHAGKDLHRADTVAPEYLGKGAEGRKRSHLEAKPGLVEKEEVSHEPKLRAPFALDGPGSGGVDLVEGVLYRLVFEGIEL